jgi:hypothetical protein
MPRLIICLDCLSTELVPDFLGSKEEEAFDPLLDLVVARHRGPLDRQQLHGRPATAPKPRQFPEVKGICDLCQGGGCRACQGSGELYQAPHHLQMHQVTPDDWASKKVREQVLHQIWEREGHQGYPEEFYAAKNTYMESAAECFIRHHRPEGYCIDWESDGMRLTDDRWQQRYHDSQKRLRELGLVPPQGMERKHVYLCQFCPVARFVQFKKNEQKGLYDG